MCRHSETEKIPRNYVTRMGFACIYNICYGLRLSYLLILHSIAVNYAIQEANALVRALGASTKTSNYVECFLVANCSFVTTYS